MGNWVIVAIPEENDPVWKISSEKVPHLTLMFLGEHDDETELESRIAEFLKHVASTSLTRFGLSVDRRGELGEKKADVVFFEKRFVKDLENIRSYLLANQDIYAMYHSNDQYPEWTPHLTLGYPESPAHPDDRDYPGVTWVRFDRLALWTGDYQGPEVLLGDNDNTLSDEVSMSDAEGGVRMKNKNIQGLLDRHGDAQVQAESFMDGFMNNVADFAHAILEGVDAKRDGPPKPGKGGKGKFDEDKVKRDGRGRFSRQDQKWLERRSELEKKLGVKVLEEVMPFHAKMAKKYGTTLWDLDYSKLSTKDQAFLDSKMLEIAEKVTARDGVSPSGKFRLAPKKVGDDIESKVVRTDKSLRQSDIDVFGDDELEYDDTLEHWGVKGMRWGIRRKVTADGTVDKSDAGTPSGKSMSEETAELQKSADFERAAKAYAKAEEKGLQSLSNEEIKAITNRVQTEKSFRALSEPQKSKLEQEIDQMRLEKSYRELKAELNQKKVGIGKKIVNAFLEGAVTTAKGAAQKQGQDLIKEMLSQSGTKKVAKSAAKTTRSSGQFKVNPAKVKITRPTSGVRVP
jgi:2'-5' RNA ligase